MIHLGRNAKTATLVLSLFALKLSTVTAQSSWTLDYRFRPGDRMAFVPDLNNDGVDELLVGNRKSPNGEVYLVNGCNFKPLRTWQGPARGSGFGSKIVVGDINGDRVVDYIVAAPGDAGGRGSISAIDGKTNNFLWTIQGTSSGSGFGMSMCLADSYPFLPDGKTDLWVGSPFHDTSAHRDAGLLELYDIQRARPLRLRSFEGGGLLQNYAWRIVNAGNLDGRGGDEIVVNGRGYYSSLSGCGGGFARMISGGLLTTSFVSNRGGSRTCFGTGLLATDMTGDGRKEILVGTGRNNRFGIAYMFEYDSATSSWKEIKQFSPQTYSLNYGFTFCRTTDLNKDGTDDLAIAGTQGIEIWSGKSWTRLFSFPAQMNIGSVGDSEVHMNGDFNGDGLPDILVTETGRRGLTRTTGSVDVYSPRAYSLSMSHNYVSIANGGAIDMDIDVGAQYAGQLYMMLGSITGSKPGVPLTRNLILPLNYDPFMDFMILGQNVVPFTNTLGFLDNAGKAKATWRAVGALSPFAPLYMEYSTIIFGFPKSFTFDAVTNARHLMMFK